MREFHIYVYLKVGVLEHMEESEVGKQTAEAVSAMLALWLRQLNPQPQRT